MTGISDNDLNTAQNRFVGKRVDTVREEIEAMLGRYDLHVASNDTIFSMQLDPNRIRVLYDTDGVIRSIRNG